MISKIKFRAKQIMTKEWVYGYYLQKHGVHLIYSPETDNEYLIEPETLSQFKGYEQGAEVYEGDLTCNSEGYGTVIERMVTMVEDHSQNIVCTGHGEYHDTNARYKVIGNIWDTPEKVYTTYYGIASKNSIMFGMDFPEQVKACVIPQENKKPTRQSDSDIADLIVSELDDMCYYEALQSLHDEVNYDI